MHRNHVGIPKLLTLQALVLFICAPAVWSQRYPYAVAAEGTATACKTKKYSKIGRVQESGSAEDSCGTIYKSSSAQSDSDADFTANHFSGNVAVDAYNSRSRALAQSIANDTVTLIPPSGYNQNSVDFAVLDNYQVSIDNSSGGTGYTKLCWKAPKLWTASKCVRRHKNTQGEVSWAARLKKSAAGFQFAIAKGSVVAGSVTGTGSWVGLYDTSADPIEFQFQQAGWSCTFASGVACDAVGP